MLVTLAPHFSVATRAKGERYYKASRVLDLTTRDGRLSALVSGTDTYSVSITFDGHVVAGACNCPFCQDGNACKHLWATLLAADERGLLPPDRHARFDIDYETLDELLGVLDEEDEFGDAADWERGTGARQVVRGPWPGSAAPGRQPSAPRWTDHLNLPEAAGGVGVPVPPAREQRILYRLDVEQSLANGGPMLQLMVNERKANGEWGKPKTTGYGYATGEADRRIIAQAAGCVAYPYSQFAYYGQHRDAFHPGSGDATPFHPGSYFKVPPPLFETLLSQVCATGRCHLGKAADLGPPVHWDAGPPWDLELDVVGSPDGQTLQVSGALRRADDRQPLTAPALLLADGLVVNDDRIARFRHFGAFPWVVALRRLGTLTVPTADLDQFLETTLLRTPQLPLSLPPDLRWDVVQGVASPRLRVRSAGAADYPRDKLFAEACFDYDGHTVTRLDRRAGLADPARKRLLLRDEAAERQAATALESVGLRYARHVRTPEPQYEIAPSQLPSLVRALHDKGWTIEADGRAIRTANRVDVRVRSGIDWFEVDGSVVYGETVVALPEVMKALERGATTVTLGDGTTGLLPEDWLTRHGFALGFGEHDGQTLRFRRSQVVLLDQLLDAMPEADVEASVTRARAELRAFDGIAPADPAEGFVGTLRAYQRDGLGWLRFLERFGFGGCLADDMGLGKTVQLLAHLHARRARGEAKGPSLIVAPRSVIFNWGVEAARFVPDMRVLDHSGAGRDHSLIDAHDLVLTTYGTLQRDAARLKDVEFDYVVLDEAHAIKNSASASAKAARLLRARHRVALTGTPVQNHLGELWSLFEFLNPGMLGAARAIAGAGARQAGGDDQLAVLRRALRPFVLRRTKEAVAPDLPPRIEQTVYCDLAGKQRTLYEQLRRHFQSSLRDRISRDGLAKSKMHVLEALLRLRQVACHPALVDKAHQVEDSAKLEVLLPRLQEVVEDGHKALVFSQFTSLLALVRKELDALGLAYVYLDGRTRDRQPRIDAFQQRDDVPLFLISLKAGGLGLNLTAADYVFLLDPWWNPAIEAQAIDRAHRIGRARQVIAYRLIARNTIEEKILELQATKRGLADAIISVDQGLLRQLTADDLDLLLA